MIKMNRGDTPDLAKGTHPALGLPAQRKGAAACTVMLRHWGDNQAEDPKMVNLPVTKGAHFFIEEISLSNTS